MATYAHLSSAKIAEVFSSSFFLLFSFFFLFFYIFLRVFYSVLQLFSSLIVLVCFGFIKSFDGETQRAFFCSRTPNLFLVICMLFTLSFSVLLIVLMHSFSWFALTALYFWCQSNLYPINVKYLKHTVVPLTSIQDSLLHQPTFLNNLIYHSF